MRVRDAHEGRFPSEGSRHNELGVRVATVELTVSEVYEAIAAFAISKRFGADRSTMGAGVMDPRSYSVSVFPDELGSFVVLGRGVRADLWDGYSEVVIRLLPEEPT